MELSEAGERKPRTQPAEIGKLHENLKGPKESKSNSHEVGFFK